MKPAIRTHPPSPNAAPRRGFTLIEMLIAIALTSLICSALMSALLLSLRAIPGENDAGLIATELSTAFEFLHADVAIASSVEVTGAKLLLTVPDQTGDATPENIVYQFQTGRLERITNNATPRILSRGINSGQFTATRADDRIASVTVVIKSTAPTMHRTSIECVARPEVP